MNSLVTRLQNRFNRNRGKFVLCCLLSIVYWLWLPSKLFQQPSSKVLVDRRGELLAAKIAEDGQWRFPASDSVPFRFKQCILQFEDEYFYRHPGFNPVSLGKAFKHNAGEHAGKRGGSTITMQVARMMHPNQARTYWLKMVEILLAVRIELSYSKEEILALYCGEAPFGSNVVGLRAASWRYFGREPDQLSWAECALLAVLPNAPSLIYPGKNQEKLLHKRNRLLTKLLVNKVLDESTYQLALQEPLPGKPYPIPQLAGHLMEYCISRAPQTNLFQSTVQQRLQVRVNELLNKHIGTLSSNHIHNACALVIDTQSGEVLAYVGNSSDAKNEFENYVDIVQAPRSTGSILKPFLYAFMLNEHKFLPSSLVEDVPTQIGSYNPKNFNLSFDGLVPANQALARSLNVPAVKMLQEYGVHRFHERLKQLGFSSFVKPSEHYGLSLILGGGEARLWDLAGAYAALGRSLSQQENRKQPSSKNPFFALQYLRDQEPRMFSGTSGLLHPSAIYSTFSAMTELLRPQDYIGWSQFISKHKIAWKTGTSFGFRDAWAIGLNPRYTVAVWVGNANGEGRPELTGTSAAAPLMFALFNLFDDKAWFKKPVYDFERVKVCTQSGYRASDICEDTKHMEVPFGGSSSKVCPFHRRIHTDASGLYRVHGNCYPVSQMRRQAWFVVSPLQELFFKQHSLFYKPLPPFMPGCADDQAVKQMELVYPREGDKIYVPVVESGEKSKCILSATHKDQEVVLYWYLDGEYAGSTRRFHQLSVLPAKGMHELTITDTYGISVHGHFEVLEK